MATLWPDYWAPLTARPAEDADPHAQVRELLVGHDITVRPKFDDDKLQDLQESADPRLAQAAAGSRDGQVIQLPGRRTGIADPLPQCSPRRPGAD
jgi:hypothetical protein